MANMMDYLAWRGDVPFSACPFNEVDNLVLAQSAYAPLDGAIAPDESLTLREAAERSGMAAHFPGLDLATCPLGIFGKAVSKPQERVLEEGERVEIYRPLLADPKEVRKQRAAKAAQAKASEG